MRFGSQEDAQKQQLCIWLWLIVVTWWKNRLDMVGKSPKFCGWYSASCETVLFQLLQLVTLHLPLSCHNFQILGQFLDSPAAPMNCYLQPQEKNGQVQSLEVEKEWLTKLLGKVGLNISTGEAPGQPLSKPWALCWFASDSSLFTSFYNKNWTELLEEEFEQLWVTFVLNIQNCVGNRNLAIVWARHSSASSFFCWSLLTNSLLGATPLATS